MHHVDNLERTKPMHIEGAELLLDLKLFFDVLSGHSFSNLEESLDICNSQWCFVATLVHCLRT